MENDKITMTKEEILKDYPRLKLEYTRLHEEFRHLQTKQLNIPGVIDSDDYHTIADKEVIEAIRCPKCKSTDTLCCRLQKPNKCLDCGNTWT